MPAMRRAMGTRARKHLRRLDAIHEGLGAPLFFITCCVRDRRAVLANRDRAQVLVAAWERSPDVHGWFVGRYVVMPDHVHFFASPGNEGPKTLSRFVGDWKRWTARQMRETPLPDFEWQKEFFDHLMRNSESYEGKWEYVRANPVRAGLVPEPDEWAFQGELYVLEG